MNEKYNNMAAYMEHSGDWDVRPLDSIHGDSVFVDLNSSDSIVNREFVTTNKEQQQLDAETLNEIRQQIDAIS